MDTPSNPLLVTDTLEQNADTRRLLRPEVRRR